MKKILLLFAHPRLEKSRTNQALLAHLPQEPWLTFRDLYETYPDFNIDVGREKELVAAHDVIVWHHPFYWYSCPPLLKQWIDMVLEFGWAYGPGGMALSGKSALNVITTGGTDDAYRHDGRNRFTIREFLAPFEQTARLCKMDYLPPYTVQGTHRLSARDLEAAARGYGEALRGLAEGRLSASTLSSRTFLQEAVAAGGVS